jgi:hypothetical protein
LRSAHRNFILETDKLERDHGPLDPPVVRWDTFGLDSAYDYDPDVVAALRRVLQRRRTEGV